MYRRPSSTASSARRGVQLRNFFLLPTSTNSTYLQPTKTRLRRLRNLFAGAAHRKRQGTTAAPNHFQDNLREDILLAPDFTMRTASVVPFINVNTSIQGMLTTQPSSTNSTYLQPTKTRLRRLRKRPKACSSPAKPRTMPGSQQQTRHHWKPATLSARRRPHLWAKPATLVVDEYSTNSAIANATIMATNPTSLEAGHLEWATPATFVGEAGHICGR